MLPLETRAELAPSAKARLLKVVSLAEFAQSGLPLERLALDLRDVPADHFSRDLLNLPWGAVLPSIGLRSPGEVPLVRLEGPPGVCKPGDVVELNPLQKKVAIRYRRGDTGNVLFATERCNSYCLMCSAAPGRSRRLAGKAPPGPDRPHRFGGTFAGDQRRGTDPAE